MGTEWAERGRAMTIAADTFVDAATQVCLATAELGMGAAVELHRASGPTGLIIDNYATATDELRRWVLTEEYWRVSPMKIEMRRQLAVHGPEAFDLPAMYSLARNHGFVGASQQPVGIPLLGPAGWFGTVCYSSHIAASAAVERQLAVLATELSCGAPRAASRRCPRFARSHAASTRSPRSPPRGARTANRRCARHLNQHREGAPQADVRAARRRESDGARDHAPAARAARRHPTGISRRGSATITRELYADTRPGTRYEG